MELASLADGHHEQDFKIDTEFFKNMENTEILSANVDVHLDIEKRNDIYDCRFTCKGKLEVPCDRCLDPLELDVDTTYHVAVKYGESYDDGADNLLVIPYSNSYLNVAYILNDTILLTIPLRHVHAQGQCNRAMADALRKHRQRNDDTEDTESLDTTDEDIEEAEA